MELRKFKAYQRSNVKKNSNRRLRNTGLIPAVIYGKKKAQINLQLNPKELVASLDPAKKRNTFMQLDIDGFGSESVIIKEVQIDSLSGKIMHVDFLRIDPTDRIKVHVPFKIIGKSAGEKIGGVLHQIIRDLPIECEVAKIPASFEYDVSEMQIDDIKRIEDLPLPEGVVIGMNPRQAIVSVTTARAVEVINDDDDDEGSEGSETESTSESAS